MQHNIVQKLCTATLTVGALNKSEDEILDIIEQRFSDQINNFQIKGNIEITQLADDENTIELTGLDCFAEWPALSTMVESTNWVNPPDYYEENYFDREDIEDILTSAVHEFADDFYDLDFDISTEEI